MASDSVESFLNLARENHLLPPDQFDELVRQPDVPQENLAALCESLLARGAITSFQAERIRTGRGRELTFAGYPILDEAGNCLGGTVVRALHPSLRTPVMVRRLRTDWLAPADNLSAFVQRAQLAAPISHENLMHILDVGAYHDELYATLIPFDGSNLESLVRDIGPMPTFLACRFAKQAAKGLDAAHGGDVAHGDIRPAHLVVGPMVQSSRKKPDGSPIVRPAHDAVLKLSEFGLVPLRPNATAWVNFHPAPTPGQLAYLPPERAENALPTAAGDIYSLGASLVFLLTSHAPFEADSAVEMAAKIASGQPLVLEYIRPDLPVKLVVLVRAMMSRNPEERPTAAVVAEQLRPFLEPPVSLLPVADNEILHSDLEVPLADSASVEVNDVALLMPAEAPVASGGWVAMPYVEPHGTQVTPTYEFADAHNPADFAPPSDEVPVARRKTGMDAAAKKRAKMWILLGVGLWILSIPLWIILLNQQGCFSGTPKPSTKPGRRG